MSTNLVHRSPKKNNKLSELFRSVIKPSAASLKEAIANEELLHIITKARQDMHEAENFFDNVTEQELIDHAIYKMEAARSRYIFLLKKAKDSGLKIEF